MALLLAALACLAVTAAPARGADPQAVGLTFTCSSVYSNNQSTDNTAAKCGVAVAYDDGTVKTYYSNPATALSAMMLARKVSSANPDVTYVDPAEVFPQDSTGAGWLPVTACSGGRYCATLALKNKPQTAQPATVAAVPTTGAPASSLMPLALGAAVGLAGVGFGLARRRG